ncbi:MAG TPA: MauE/DoxX family redox-associated membrane protein [Balneolales bacterium]|nr:MauE/DoxX family redox-associated membrane protein [Balneolales bacterium]
MRLQTILSKVFSLIMGVIFIVSGFSKLLNVQNFIGYITSVRIFDKFFFVGFLIPPFEIALGIFFLLFLHSRKTALASVISLLVFTFVYLFAYFTSGLTDCGCFGGLALSKMPPALIVVRNAVFLFLSGYVFFKPVPKPKLQNKRWPYYSVGAMLTITLVLSGISSIKPFVHQSNNFVGKKVSETPFGSYVHTSPDSTYIIYAYHTTCPYCLNSIENVKAYARTHTVDRVIGITIGSKKEFDNFEEVAVPNFSSIIISKGDFEKFAPSVPRVFIVRKNIITDVLYFPVTGPYVYWRSHPDMRPAGMPKSY